MKTKDSFKLFFDYWAFFDEPSNFPFFKVLRNDGEAVLIQNEIVRDVNYYVWISEQEPDISYLLSSSNSLKIILNAFCSSTQSDFFTGQSDQYCVKLLECAVVYENKNKTMQDVAIPPDFSVQMATKDDFEQIDDILNEEMRHDYINQLRDAVDDNSMEVFALRYKNQPACFLALEDIVSIKYGYQGKHMPVIVTLPQYRHKGFASYLINFVMNLHANTEFMYVADSNNNIASMKLAEKTNFLKIGYNMQCEIIKKND